MASAMPSRWGLSWGMVRRLVCFFHSDRVTEAEADWREKAMRLRAALAAAVVTLAAHTDTQRS